jgi:hypothetical protein
MLTSQSDSLDAALHAASASTDGSHRWAIKERHYVKLGALDAWIHCATKEPTPDGAARTVNVRQQTKREAEEVNRSANEEKERRRKKKANVDDYGGSEEEEEEEESSDNERGGMALKVEDKDERRNRIFSALYFHRK